MSWMPWQIVCTSMQHEKGKMSAAEATFWKSVHFSPCVVSKDDVGPGQQLSSTCDKTCLTTSWSCCTVWLQNQMNRECQTVWLHCLDWI